LPKTKAKEQERRSYTLNHERDLLAPGQRLHQFKYRPTLPPKYYYGKDEDAGVVFLVMERLDADLVGWARTRLNLTLKDIAEIGLQILDGLQWLHSKGYLFVDTKPENFMLRGNEVVFVDYGLATRFGTQFAGAKNNQPRALIGTPAFVSLAVHEGAAHSRRDELESLAFVLLSMCSQGRLPWSNATSEAEVLELKRACDVTELAASCQCGGLGEFVMRNRQSPADNAPDYAAFESVLQEMKALKVPLRDGAAATPTGNVARVAKGVSKRAPREGGKPCSKENLSNKKAGRDNPGASSTKSIRGGKRKADVDEDEGDISEDEKAGRGPSTPEAKERKSVAATDKLRTTAPASRGSETSKRELLSKEREMLTARGSERTRRSSRNYLDRPTACAAARGERKKSEIQQKRELYLTILDGPHVGERFHMGSNNEKSLTSGMHEGAEASQSSFSQLLIGRAENADFSLNKDGHISENHVTAIWSWGPRGELDLNVQDRNSTNGTLVNEKDLKPKVWERVFVGDEISIGETILRVDMEVS
jgi:serine/threonine protein kinase